MNKTVVTNSIAASPHQCGHTWARYDDAFLLATTLHAKQKRKTNGVPYIYHLMSVSALVLKYGGDEDQAIAALLHDMLEDCGPQFEPIIRKQFGDRVADIVIGCTDTNLSAAPGTPKAPWIERKTAYLKNLALASVDVALVCGCDKLHNAGDLLEDLRAASSAEQAVIMGKFKGGKDGTLWYYNEVARIIGEKLPADHQLLAKELKRVVAELTQVANLVTAPPQNG